jgi:arylsulfatase A-like enzyme
MLRPTGNFEKPGAPPPAQGMEQSSIVSCLAITVWCGLVAGLLEVGTVVIRKHSIDPNHLYGMSRHFVWLVPIANVCIFLVLGSGAFLAGLASQRDKRWLFSRVMCTLTLLPLLLAAFPKIYGMALLLVALGLAGRLVLQVERNRRGFRRLVRYSFPVFAGAVMILGTSLWFDAWRKQTRASARPLPAAGSPNVLLIVLDTVAASHLSLHGYDRQTSLTLAELAERGVRFDRARASSSWSLPTHATMFTGRWLHELSAGWLTPLDNTYPTIAEFLGMRGYATVGFVANTVYCASDSGLSRGFTRYHDFIFPELTTFKPAVLVNRACAGLQSTVEFLEDGLELERLRPYTDWLWRKLEDDRKAAAVVNREFIDWLQNRQQPERPFFAFLNYFDAHYPYQLPTGRMHRFGFEPTNTRQRVLIREWFSLSRTGISPGEIAFAISSYDDCIADLDEQLGRLFDDLDGRGVLDRTWVIITSDHGESFGEHDYIFCHGTSLHQTELHVPLLIIPPGGEPTQKVVNETVSLRDLAATIVDVTGQKAGSPFPGTSLIRFWEAKTSGGSEGRGTFDFAPAELALPSVPPSRDPERIPKTSWPKGGLTEGEWSYIKHEGDVREELYHLRDDGAERHNLAADPARSPTLERMRHMLDQLTEGPLSPRRFSP